MIDAVLRRLREGLGLAPATFAAQANVQQGRDGYLPGSSDELFYFNLVNTLIEEVAEMPDPSWWNVKLGQFKSLEGFRALSPEQRSEAIPFLILRIRWIRSELRHPSWMSHLDFKNAPKQSVLQVLVSLLGDQLRRSYIVTPTLIQLAAESFRPGRDWFRWTGDLSADDCIRIIAGAREKRLLSEKQKSRILSYLHNEKAGAGLSNAQCIALQQAATGDRLVIIDHDPFGKYIWDSLAALQEQQQPPWMAWLAVLSEVEGAPSKKQLKALKEPEAIIGTAALVAETSLWLSAAVRAPIASTNAVPYLVDLNARLAAVIFTVTLPLDPHHLLPIGEQLVQKAFSKLPNIGCVAVGMGNQIIRAIAAQGAIGLETLGRLRPKLKNAPSPTLKLYEKLLRAAAESAGLTLEGLQDQLVPSFDMNAEGVAERSLGDCVAQLKVANCKAVNLEWSARGKAVKSVPQAVKNDFAAELKELKQQHKHLQSFVTATRERIESYFLDRRIFTWSELRSRWFEHPLLRLFARRLIWQVPALGPLRFDGETWLDAGGRSMPGPSEDSELELWHPITSTPEEVRLWRAHFDSRQLQQPVKQAYREVYQLTPAEEQTEVYSNRMAAHILRQHQFNQLAKQRGWRYALQGSFDNGNNGLAVKAIADTDLEAQYWVEPIGVFGDNYEQHTTDAGIALHLATDQIRFRRGQDAVPLREVPKVIFSEVMRDVDLFVGVASIGSDPNWSDAGPEGRFHEYWAAYSFGELTESAKSRRELLEKIIPRLAIADKCTIADRYLVVTGQRKTYKIHLGSGNILMSPNDQYLCIVPARDPKALSSNRVFLPFDGDAIFSIILSKAMLLAADDEITDPTILRQLS